MALEATITTQDAEQRNATADAKSNERAIDDMFERLQNALFRKHTDLRLEITRHAQLGNSVSLAISEAAYTEMISNLDALVKIAGINVKTKDKTNTDQSNAEQKQMECDNSNKQMPSKPPIPIRRKSRRGGPQLLDLQNVVRYRNTLETLIQWTGGDTKDLTVRYDGGGGMNTAWTCLCSLKLPFIRHRMEVKTVGASKRKAMKKASKMMIDVLLEHPLPIRLSVIREGGQRTDIRPQYTVSAGTLQQKQVRQRSYYRKKTSDTRAGPNASTTG